MIEICCGETVSLTELLVGFLRAYARQIVANNMPEEAVAVISVS
jgi:hypothetical protein